MPPSDSVRKCGLRLISNIPDLIQRNSLVSYNGATVGFDNTDFEEVFDRWRVRFLQRYGIKGLARPDTVSALGSLSRPPKAKPADH